MNPTLIVAFFVLTLLSFGIIMYVMRPGPDQKAVEKRLVSIKTRQGEFAPVTERLDQYLRPAEHKSFGWVEEMIETSVFSQNLKVLIVQADSKTSVGTVLISCVGVGVATAIVMFLILPIPYIVLPLGCAAGYAPMMVLKFKRNSRLKKFNAALADCIDMMARSLRAGHSLIAAISIVAEQAAEPARSEFGEVFKKQNFGLPLRDGLMQMLDRVPSQDLRVLVTGILVQKDTGGNLAEILDRIVDVIRERIRVHGEIKTHTAQGRMTGWILCLLPVVMLVLINMINPGYSDVLFHDPFGQKMLAGGVVLLLMGGFIIRQIINGIEV